MLKINVSPERIVDLLIYVYSQHKHANTIDQDGKPCRYCGKEIPLLYPTCFSKLTGRAFVKVDRSNRVDVNLKNNRVASYHINCWKNIIFHD